MASNHQNGDWTVRKAPRRVRDLLEIRNGRGTLATVYADEHTAKIMAAGKRAIRILKAFVRAGQSGPAYSEALDQAKALIAEVSA